MNNLRRALAICTKANTLRTLTSYNENTFHDLLSTTPCDRWGASLSAGCQDSVQSGLCVDHRLVDYQPCGVRALDRRVCTVFECGASPALSLLRNGGLREPCDEF